jgi:hypothetical protein
MKLVSGWTSGERDEQPWHSFFGKVVGLGKGVRVDVVFRKVFKIPPDLVTIPDAIDVLNATEARFRS